MKCVQPAPATYPHYCPQLLHIVISTLSIGLSTPCDAPFLPLFPGIGGPVRFAQHTAGNRLQRTVRTEPERAVLLLIPLVIRKLSLGVPERPLAVVFSAAVSARGVPPEGTGLTSIEILEEFPLLAAAASFPIHMSIEEGPSVSPDLFLRSI